MISITMMFRTFIVSLCFYLAFGERISYEGYKVYRVTPKTKEEAKILHELNGNTDYDFWAEPRMLDVPATVMVAPEAQKGFENSMSSHNINMSIYIGDVERTVQMEASQRSKHKLRTGEVTFNRYMNHEEINNYLIALARRYPNQTKLENLGKSYENRNLLALRISSGGSNKPTIFIDAGIHAREWIAPPVAVYIIHQLVENRLNANLFKDIDWVILPVLNPDGYEFSRNVNALWRKTRSHSHVECIGVDGNRNFDYYWMETGASMDPCSLIFAGFIPFSESETIALRNYLLSNKGLIKLYLTFHSYGQYLLYPWGYTNTLPSNNDELYNLGVSVASSIASVNGTTYLTGSSSNLLYPAAGGSDDYAMGPGGVDLSYTIELPAGGLRGFQPPEPRILPIVEETWEGVKAYQHYVQQKYVV